MHMNAFPDLEGEPEQLVAEGDFVLSRVRLSGTHKGELMGMAPKGEKLDLKWVMRLDAALVAPTNQGMVYPYQVPRRWG